MALKQVNGYVRTFIPHSLKKMPTSGRITRILYKLRRQGKFFAINVNLASSNLISQINIGAPLAQTIAKYLHNNNMSLKIGTSVKILAKPIGFGQMDAVRILKIGRKNIVKHVKSSAFKNVTSSASMKPSSIASSASSASSVSIKSTVSSASATSTTSSMFNKLDNLTADSSDEAINHKIAIMYRRLEKHPTDVKSIPKQLKPIFEQEDWRGFIKKLNKSARSDFDRIINNPHVNHWMNYALRSNYVPRDLDNIDKIRPKKKKTSNHKDVF